MTRHLAILLALFPILTGMCDDSQTPAKVLRILNWTDYIEIDDNSDASLPDSQRSPILKAFAEMHDCEIVYQTYSDSAESTEYLSSVPGFFDLVCLSRDDAEDLLKLGLIGNIDLGRVTEFDRKSISEVFPTIITEFDYGIPYLLGTTGIIYRNDIIETPPKSWADFFQSSDYPNERIGIFTDAEVVFSLMFRALGADPNSKEESDYAKAAGLLYELHKNQRFGLLSSEFSDIEKALLDGTISMAITYSGEAAVAQDEHSHLTYHIPDDGGEVYLDLWTMPTQSKNSELAYEFLNYITQAEISASNSHYLGYANPQRSAREILQKENPDFLLNPAIYPSHEASQNLFEINGEPELSAMYWKRVFK